VDRETFNPRLEGLRGLAALAVCGHHGMSAFSDGSTPTILGWLLYAFNPAAAVMFFFVLSGYVLGCAIERDSNFVGYITRRFFRLVPPFVFSVLFAFACVTLVRIDPMPFGLTDFFQRPFWPQPTLDQLSDNLILRSSWINGPTWSILPELVGSFFLPVLVWLHRSTSPRSQWLLFVGLSTAIAFSPLRLLFWFYAGFFLAKKIGDFLTGRNFLALPVFVVGFVFLRAVAEHAVYYKTATVFPSAIAAALMIGSVISSQSFMRWTELPPVRFLGRVSFSFYLLHWPIFYLCAMLAVACRPVIAVGNVGILLLTIATTLIAAAISYQYVEIPAIRSGKYLSGLFRSPVESMARRWRAASPN